MNSPESQAQQPNDRDRLEAALAGRYQVTGIVGAGGMSTVYGATDLKHQRRVAIKVLRVELSRAIGTERFLREIEIAAALQHPRILPLYDSGSGNGLLYYVMPFVEGESLRSRLTRERQLPIEEALRIAREVASALAYAHARGIVHRDIKPDNVLLSGGESVVADFGIARALDAAAGPRMTSDGMTVGTPEYMSPEQISTEGELDARSDIYSLGCLLYEMIAGRPPYSAPSMDRVLMQHLAAPVPQLSALVPGIAPAIDAAIQRALAKSPDERFDSAAAFAEALATTASVPAQTVSQPVLAARAPSRRLLLTGALALVAAIGVFAVVLRERPPTADASVIAVFPFRVSGDSSFLFLREGMVDLLTTQLGAMSGMRPVDSRTVLAAWRREVPAGDDPATADAQRLAARLGSGRLVLGEVVGTAAGVAISARIIDAVSTRQTEATVQGPADSLYVLVDRLTSQLLAGSAGEPTRRLAELTSASLPAVRAYLEGRVAYRRGELTRATERFSEALALDSTFALAALGMASAGVWSQQSGQSAALRRGLRTGYALRDRLPARDRLLFEAYVVPDSGGAVTSARQLAGWRRAAEGVPESAEAQFEYGDRLYHSGVQLGEADAWPRAQAAFARALALDSSFAAPLAHLVEMAARAGERERTRQLEALYRSEAAVADAGDYVRWRVALTLGDTRTLSDIRRRRAQLSLTSLNRLVGFGQVDAIALADVDSAGAELARRLERGAVGGRPLLAGETLHALAMNRGRRDAVPATVAALRAHQAMAPGNSIVYFDADQVPVLDALFWDGDSTAAVASANRLAQRVALPPPDGSDAQARYDTNLCVLALWRLSLGQSADADGLVERLRDRAERRAGNAVSGADPTLCVAMLDAMAASAAPPGAASPSRDTSSATDAIAAVARLDSLLAQGPYVFGVDFGNLVLARMHEGLGNRPAALRAIRRRPFDWDTGPLYLTTYLREEGRLAALVGDRAGAERAYTRYLTLREGADAALAAHSERVLGALGRVRGEGG